MLNALVLRHTIAALLCPFALSDKHFVSLLRDAQRLLHDHDFDGSKQYQSATSEVLQRFQRNQRHQTTHSELCAELSRV